MKTSWSWITPLQNVPIPLPDLWQHCLPGVGSVTTIPPPSPEKKAIPEFVPFQAPGRSDKAPVHHGLSATWHMCTNVEIPVDGVRFPSMPQPLRTGKKQNARGWHQQQLLLDTAAAFIAYARTVFNQINHIMWWKTSRRPWQQRCCRDNRSSGGSRTDDLRQMSTLHFLCSLQFLDCVSYGHHFVMSPETLMPYRAFCNFQFSKFLFHFEPQASM